MTQEPTLRVEVVYALPDHQALVTVALPPGATVACAIKASQLPSRFPAIDLAVHKAGIYGRITPLTTPVQDGDRVEIYRPLTVDPPTLRRHRAAFAKGQAKVKPRSKAKDRP
ncbi:MAG: RnfH family protein [Candidatus Competibacterales bacterium]